MKRKMLPSVELLQLLLIFSLGIAYASQTRIKIGAQTWGYQIETNQGRDVRTEFASPDGIILGSFIYKLGDETKKLEYRIDPNRMEPDIGFNVTTVAPMNSKQQQGQDAAAAPRDGRRFTEAEEIDSSASSSNSTLQNDNEIEKDVVSVPNVSFDSIDSKQDFKGHVSLKVANRSYVINFVTGDKSNSREESLTSAGMLLGRLNFMGKNTLTKLVINYKFNTSAPDPTFEVSLYRTLESESSDSGRPYNPPFYNRDALPHNHHNHHAQNSHREQMSRDSYRDRLTYFNPRSHGSASSSSPSSSSSSLGSSPYSSPYSPAIPMSPAVKQQQFLAEKYRQPMSRDERYRDRYDRERERYERDRERFERPEPVYRQNMDRQNSIPSSSSSSQNSSPSSSSQNSPNSSSSSSSPSSSSSSSPSSSSTSSSSNDRSRDDGSSSSAPQQPSWYYPTNRNKIYDP